jgi:acyl-coenzyme A synthetase/AMP-(fatty) acid ligase/thioesterase domain-containing protein/acyl carrier protein
LTLRGALVSPGHLDFDRSGTALEHRGRKVGWSELGDRVRSVEVRLRDCGAGPGSRVLTQMGLSPGYIAVLLAILRLDAVVVPAGDDPPPGHLAEIRRLCQPEVEVDSSGRVTRVPGDGRPSRRSVGDDEAHIHMTSGSTGSPKAVVGSRSGLGARIAWAIDRLFSDDADRCAARAAPTFIDGLTEVLGALHSGRLLVVAPPEAVGDIGVLRHFLAEYGVNQVTLPPSFLPTLGRREDWRLPEMRRWILTGEPLRKSWAEIARRTSPGATIVNSYGSTEVAGDVCLFEVTPEEAIPDPVPIGEPVAGVEWRIAEDGELLLGGPQVALGYLSGAEGEPSPFWREPGDSAGAQGAHVRWYRSGDLVRAEGTRLVHLGRADDVHQVRGRRVGLGGVEQFIERHDSVAEAAARVTVEGGSSRLDAWVVPVEGRDLVVADLRADLGERVPAHLVPDSFTVVSSLPRTSSGKVDRSALPVPSGSQPPARGDFGSDLELAIATVIQRCAPTVQPDRTTDLGTMGVDSLQLVEVAEVLGDTLGVPLTAVELATWGSVEMAASHLMVRDPSAGRGCLRQARPGAAHRVLVMLPPAIGSGLCYFRLLPHLRCEHTVELVEQDHRLVDLVQRGGLDALGRGVAAAVEGAHPGAVVTYLGWSFGALAALHCSEATLRGGGQVDALVLVDPARSRAAASSSPVDWAVRRILTDFGYERELGPAPLTADDGLAAVASGAGVLEAVSAPLFRHWVATMAVNVSALSAAFPDPPAVRTLVVRGGRTLSEMEVPRWVEEGGDRPDHVEVRVLDASHFELLAPASSVALGAAVSGYLVG